MHLVSLLLLVCAASITTADRASNARWIVHSLSYGVLSTTSVQYDGVAFGNPQSFVDGTLDNSTGNIYMYVSGLDASMIDITAKPQASFTLSEEMINNDCSRQEVDPEDPMCMRVVLIGSVKNVTVDEGTFAKDALLARHPGMKSWPDHHSFYVVALKPQYLWVLDGYGGVVKVTAAEFFAAQPIAPPRRNGTSPIPSPGKAPFFTEKAKTARWMAHHLSFGVLSTTSANSEYKGVAFGNPQSFADGTIDNSTGQLYFYMAKIDASRHDIAANPKATWVLSEQMLSSYCTSKSLDPEDPRCGRCVFIGNMRIATPTEIPGAKDALFTRHPAMRDWPAEHMFEVYKMDIESIWLLNMFGGASIIMPGDYYKAKP